MDYEKEIEDLKKMVADLQYAKDNPRLIDLSTDMEGIFETVSVAPTNIPKSPYDQIKIYVNGATLRFYWFDGNANVWHYVTATA